MPAEHSRSDYRYFVPITTRWMDNDVYGHVNNVVYYSYFDTVINEWLIREGGLDIHRGEAIGVCVESHCEYKGSLEFPDPVDACLRVGKLGRSSVRYEIALFRGGADEPAATGWFVHVFVDRDSRRPVDMPAGIRACLERLLVPASSEATA